MIAADAGRSAGFLANRRMTNTDNSRGIAGLISWTGVGWSFITDMSVARVRLMPK